MIQKPEQLREIRARWLLPSNPSWGCSFGALSQPQSWNSSLHRQGRREGIQGVTAGGFWVILGHFESFLGYRRFKIPSNPTIPRFQGFSEQLGWHSVQPPPKTTKTNCSFVLSAKIPLIFAEKYPQFPPFFFCQLLSGF